MSAAPAPEPSPEQYDRRSAGMAFRMMNDQARETWLVPLLAVPLAIVAGLCTDRELEEYSAQDPQRIRQSAVRIEALFERGACPEETGLTEEHALLLVEFVVNARLLCRAFLHPPPILQRGVGIPEDLPGDPLIRDVAEWVSSGTAPVPLTALLASYILLPLIDNHRDYIPRAHARFAGVTRAIARRMADENVRDWAAALRIARTFWTDDGWPKLGMWQQQALRSLLDSGQYDAAQIAAEAHAKAVRLHREERKRLQAAASQAHDELRKLRPLRREIVHLREEDNRLRLREAELIQARDRAQARVGALESMVHGLERDLKATKLRLVELMPPPVPLSTPEPLQEQTPQRAPQQDDALPSALLKGRTVFFFTGQMRKSAAELAGDSLCALGPRVIRKFCVHKGSLGPEVFPPDALVVIDTRFIAHKHSDAIQDRARRSGVECLAVKSGKGGLARAVAAAATRHRDAPSSD